MSLTWLLSTVETLVKSFLAALGVGGGFVLIIWLVKKFAQEEIRHVFERERLAIAHKQKMVETMVLQLHEFTKNYYMAMITAVGSFALYLQQVKYDLALRSLAEFLAAFQRLRSEIHGYFLKDIIAERVISQLDYSFRREYLHIDSGGFLKLGEQELLAKSFRYDMHLDEFMGKVERDTNLKEVRDRFLDWARDEEKKRKLILMAETPEKVFKLEVNFPYEAWYGKIPSHFTEENFALLRKQTAALVAEASLSTEEVDSYFKKLEPFKT